MHNSLRCIYFYVRLEVVSWVGIIFQTNAFQVGRFYINSHIVCCQLLKYSFTLSHHPQYCRCQQHPNVTNMSRAMIYALFCSWKNRLLCGQNNSAHLLWLYEMHTCAKENACLLFVVLCALIVVWIYHKRWVCIVCRRLLRSLPDKGKKISEFAEKVRLAIDQHNEEERRRSLLSAARTDLQSKYQQAFTMQSRALPNTTPASHQNRQGAAAGDVVHKRGASAISAHVQENTTLDQPQDQFVSIAAAGETMETAAAGASLNSDETKDGDLVEALERVRLSETSTGFSSESKDLLNSTARDNYFLREHTPKEPHFLTVLEKTENTSAPRKLKFKPNQWVGFVWWCDEGFCKHYIIYLHDHVHFKSHLLHTVFPGCPTGVTFLPQGPRHPASLLKAHRRSQHRPGRSGTENTWMTSLQPNSLFSTTARPSFCLWKNRLCSWGNKSKSSRLVQPTHFYTCSVHSELQEDWCGQKIPLDKSKCCWTGLCHNEQQ